MSRVFADYGEAYRCARELAREMGREVGLERAKEYGKWVYRVKHLPPAGQRFGWELRCEVVGPEALPWGKRGGE